MLRRKERGAQKISIKKLREKLGNFFHIMEHLPVLKLLLLRKLEKLQGSYLQAIEFSYSASFINIFSVPICPNDTFSTRKLYDFIHRINVS